MNQYCYFVDRGYFADRDRMRIAELQAWPHFLAPLCGGQWLSYVRRKL